MAYMQQGPAPKNAVYNLWEKSGIGAFDQVGDWSWQYYPPPYDFLAPADSVAIAPPVLFTRSSGRNHAHGEGLNGLGGGCHCGGTCGHCWGVSGLGLFDSMDMSTWGVGEWGVVAVGGYLAIKIFSDLSRGGRAVRKTVRRRRSRSAKRARLASELEAA
jgi:hypothetical protein